MVTITQLHKKVNKLGGEIRASVLGTVWVTNKLGNHWVTDINCWLDNSTDRDIERIMNFSKSNIREGFVHRDPTILSERLHDKTLGRYFPIIDNDAYGNKSTYLGTD